MRAFAHRLFPRLGLGASAPKAKPPPAVVLDCSQPFEALTATITAQPGLKPAPEEAGEPYRVYSTADGRAYLTAVEGRQWFIEATYD